MNTDSDDASKMSLVEDQDASRSSSASLSSPPHSPEPASPSAAHESAANDSPLTITVNNNPITASIPGPVLSSNGLPEKPPRKKPGRKPKPIDPNDPNPPKPRKPRAKKDPNAPVVKRGPRKSKEVAGTSTLTGLSAAAGFSRPLPSNGGPEPAYANIHAASGIHDPIHNQSPQPIQSFFNAPPPPPPPSAHHHQQQQLISHPVRTSGQNYDPIRSNFDPIRDYPSQGSPNHPALAMNRASASPSISSLVDPPNQALTSPSIAAQSFFNQQNHRTHRDDSHPSVPSSPNSNRLAPAALIEPSAHTPPAPIVRPMPSSISEEGRTRKLQKQNNGSTATSSAGASPKPNKLKEAKDTYPTPPPLPGSGLMQLGGINGGPNDGTEFRAPTVVLNIPMNGETNKYVNFTRMAEERYGWDALHPRLAAQRDRLARVAAAGAAIENSGSNRDSGDDASLDSEGENSNAEMGGMSDGRTGTDGGAKKVPRKRKMKEDEYDKDDDFVDDTELLWEEQAAATNDGFFVYSGPLVPEGEKPSLDLRADGAPKRGRGRGSRGGSTRGSGRGAATGVGRGGLPLSGPGSRGGSTTRKPRITKADRARMEQEKRDRESMGGTMGIPNQNIYSTPGSTMTTGASMGNTPIIFN